MILVLTDAPKLSKIDKIKALRQPLGLSTLAAKDAIDQLEETGYGIVMHVESPRAIESVDADLLTLQRQGFRFAWVGNAEDATVYGKQPPEPAAEPELDATKIALVLVGSVGPVKALITARYLAELNVPGMTEAIKVISDTFPAVEL